MRNRQSFFWLWLCGLLLVIQIFPKIGLADEEIRSWADKSGKNKIKAKFIRLEDDLVTLEKADGEEIEIELKKLSTADQKYIADAAKKGDDSPFKSKSDDPFKSKSSGKKTKADSDSAKGSEESSGGLRTVKVDLSKAEYIQLGSPEEDWKVEITATGPSPVTGKTKAISIPSKSEFFDSLSGLVVSRGENPKVAVVGYLLDKPGNDSVSRITICDLSTSKSGPPAVAAGKMVPIAVHDDGRQVVMRSKEFGFGKQDRLEVWTPKGTKISKSIEWTPYDSEQGGGRDVLWGEFAGPERFVTCSSNGKVVVWKFPEIDPVCQFDTLGGSIPAISPDRTLIAFSTGKDIGVVNIDKQEIIAQQATPVPLNWPCLAFSPSGSRLACVAHDKLLVWELANGELVYNIPLTGIAVQNSIEFTDSNFVLVGKKYLIDLENQLKLWTYDGADQVQTVRGLTYFAVSDGDKKPGAIVPAQIPHSAAKELLKKALTEPELFILKAGTSVRIDVNGIPDATQRERVAKSLNSRLEAINCKGGTTGTIDIVATVEGPKETEVRFMRIGTYKFKEYACIVKLVYKNQPAWEMRQTNSPGFVQLKAGENMEGHLRGLERPNYDFFDRVELPRLLQKPNAGQGPTHSLTLGQSKVTVGGMR